jgi:hypothetical protein
MLILGSDFFLGLIREVKRLDVEIWKTKRTINRRF